MKLKVDDIYIGRFNILNLPWKVTPSTTISLLVQTTNNDLTWGWNTPARGVISPTLSTISAKPS